jgi:hypothetical protein
MPFFVHLMGIRFSLHGLVVVPGGLVVRDGLEVILGGPVAYVVDVTTCVVVDVTRVGLVVSCTLGVVDPEDCPVLVVVPDGVEMVVDINVVPFVCSKEVPTDDGLVKHPSSSP